MKTILIDGHNLIPKIPGLHLDDLDDETKLLEILLEYCRLAKTRAELFFDKAPAGYAPKTNYGYIHVHPVRAGLIADDAIIAFLRASGKSARNMAVVSSDHRVQVEARALHAGVITSEEFSAAIRRVLSSPQAEQAAREKLLSPEEIERWEELFRSGGKSD